MKVERRMNSFRLIAHFAKYLVCIFLVGVLLPSKLWAFPNPPITYLGIEKGLSNNSVRCIYQDHQGFMWFGTYDGLNRYDGYEFQVFRNKLNDSTSLPHNYIYTIHEDGEQNLWVGTGQGIGIYNSLTGKFLPAYYTPYGTKGWAKITSNVNVVRSDAKGNILIGTNGAGLMVRLKGQQTAVQVPFIVGGKAVVDANVRAIYVDKSKRIWLLIRGTGLCVFDMASREIRLVNDQLTNAQCLAMGAGDDLWIGTVSGLYTYHIASRSMTLAYNEASGKLTSDNITNLLVDRQGKLWIGTEVGGVNILNPATGQFEYLLPGTGKNTLTSEQVFAIYEDKESRKWIGTVKGGIDVLDPHKNLFQTLSHDPLNRNSLVNDFASTFYEDGAQRLWIGTDGGGLSIWDRRRNSFTNYVHQTGNPGSLSHNSVTSVQQDYQNNVWVATFGGGINKFNPSSNSFEHYRCINSATGEENKNVWLLLEDHNKTLWATTFAQGKLYRLNRAANRFEVFDQVLNDLVSLIEDRQGQLWGGNSHQLAKIDTRSGQHTLFEIGKPVRALYEDRKGAFWIGTEGGGLIRFDRKGGKIAARFSDENGLCNNAVLNILEDDRGHLWLSTFNGLSEFDPVAKTFKNFYQEDGLQSNQFLYNAALRLRSGELAFGGIRGFNLFHPAGIIATNSNPPLLLTGLKVNNKPVTQDTRYVSGSGSRGIEALRIPYSDAVLSLDFAALEYSAPGKIQYAYYLDGWDKGWNYTGDLRTANYTHLSEGIYYLRLKATNADGVWGKEQTLLKVTILPPWYRSWWAWLFYMMLAMGAIYAYQLYKARQTKLEYDIKIAHLNAEKEREINDKRISFFTHVSHEFRTPLTLIINPIKDLLQHKDKSVQEGDLQIIYRNARRLLSLVDQLLLFRKADVQADTLKLARLNFYSLCHEVYLCFVQQARVKNIDYTFRCDNEQLELVADREKMEVILYNLVSNALKYTPEGGRVAFEVTEGAERVEVLVSDNGIGIPSDVGSRLFDKFYRVAREQKTGHTGFGIGLYLVKQYAESHKGEITYTSTPGQGTFFQLQLRKGAAHFGSLPIAEDTGAVTIKEEVVLHDDFAQVGAPESEPEPLGSLVSERQTLVVVDDDASIRQYLVQLFKDRFTVYEADNGIDALHLAQQYGPDLVISDVMMGGLNGIDLCQTIKEDPALGHIPVILLTASSSADIKLKGVEGGADDYINKPFDKELLLARVANLLKSRTSLQRYFYNEITLKKNELKISSEYKEFLERCIAVVEKYLDDEEFNIKRLSQELGMSHSSLYKKVKSISGLSMNAFIRFIRLRKAAELFINTDYNVNETAVQVGINDIKYFREQFNKLFGMNPSEYIKKYRKVFSDKYRVSKKSVEE